MKIEDIKAGEKYYVQVKVSQVHDDGVTVYTVNENGVGIQERDFEGEDLRAFLPATDKFKHNPWRKFKKGDKVRVVEWYGRRPQCEAYLGKEFIVGKDETPLGVRILVGETGESYCTPDACFLELVTPVEEIEPYHIETCAESVYVMDKKSGILACYDGDVHPNAREAAEAECKRLNEQYRKKENYEAGRIGAHGKY